MISWNLNQLELVNLTNILVDMCLTNILLNRLVICLTNVIGWKLNQLELINLTNILVDMCLTNILVKYIGYLFNQCDWLET